MSEKSKKIIKKPNPFIYYPCLFLVELFLKFKLRTTYDRSGLEGIKEASYDLPGKTVKVCVASGLANAKKVLDGVENGTLDYDFI